MNDLVSTKVYEIDPVTNGVTIHTVSSNSTEEALIGIKDNKAYLLKAAGVSTGVSGQVEYIDLSNDTRTNVKNPDTFPYIQPLNAEAFLDSGYRKDRLRIR